MLYHLIGHWCFQVAAMTWVERKAASALFGEPPSATYEETLAHFEKVSLCWIIPYHTIPYHTIPYHTIQAEALTVGGWKSNLLMIAKVCTLRGLVLLICVLTNSYIKLDL